jgi:tetratricopeptide (TPR) repeat protein/tRNA A-37 threonylcarbamoyl transferase component Bud32
MTDAPHPFVHPEAIGPYRILQLLGEGGMGVVYEAEQTSPLRRRVALKVMKVGMDTKEVVARFEAERQALAVMSHPGIAKVFDGGASETGRPYFVMELVKGIPITDYCDQRRLGLRERLGLFIRVCQAVQHAHQKGVIHRDLKPSNILVTEEDGEAVPKIIDFGIAKAISQRLTEQTLVTVYGTAMGTLAYMSPEQAEMSTLDVDTRADIYSLGVMLYELMVGELPSDPDTLGYQAFVLQLLSRETDAPRPSSRMSTAHNRRYLAQLRRTDSGSLSKVLKGDLDWIALKAMEKDRNRRYETANGLAADLQRYLRSEPVTARPPTAWYRFRTFARRNRAGVAAGAAVAAALVTGVVLATVGLVRATRAERVARQEAETARATSDFLVRLFEQSDPGQTRGHEVTLREVLQDGARQVRAELGDRPALQARLLATIGQAWFGLGRLDSAQAAIEEALAIETAHAAPAADVAHAQVQLAQVLNEAGEFARAEMLNREALATYRREFGDAYRPEVAEATTVLAFSFVRRRAHEAEGVTLLRDLLARQRAAGVDDADLAGTMDVLCQLLLDVGDPDGARDLCLNTLAIRRRLYGPDDFGVAVSLQRAGIVNRLQGRFDEALADYREALATNLRLHGPDNIEEAWNHYDLSMTFRAMGSTDSALAHAREAVRLRRRWLEDDNPMLAEALTELATVLRLRGDLRGSVQAFAEGIEVTERRLRSRPDTAPEALIDLMAQHGRYAALLRATGRPDQARAQDARVIELLDSLRSGGRLGDGAPALMLNNVCWRVSLAGYGADALPACDAAVAASDESSRPRIRDSRGVARSLTGDYAGAAEDFEAYVARPANAAGVPRRRAWIAALRQGRNPFTRAALDSLELN